MCNRKLVYADDICRYIKTEINPYGKPFQGSAYELGLKIMEHIEKMSAAYDVDRVVEQIDNEVPNITNLQLIKIDDIVKSGGVNQTN